MQPLFSALPETANCLSSSFTMRGGVGGWQQSCSQSSALHWLGGPLGPCIDWLKVEIWPLLSCIGTAVPLTRWEPRWMWCALPLLWVRTYTSSLTTWIFKSLLFQSLSIIQPSSDFPKVHNFTVASGVTFLTPFLAEMVVTEWCFSAMSCWWTWPLLIHEVPLVDFPLLKNGCYSWDV